jgi:Putative DnaT-like ssDNA binding protein
MASVLIGSQTYTTYATEPEADVYLNASVSVATWSDLSDDDKGRNLVAATRTLDRQRWKGEKTDPDQELAWPRTDTGVDGVEDDVIPQPIIDASIELALAIAGGSDVQDAQNQAQKIQQLKAGSVALTFFRGADGVPLRFPLIVQELVGDYLAGSGADLAGSASGVTGVSISDDDYGFTEGV